MDFAEILIVDDDMGIRNALRRELRFKVAGIHLAEDATQALEVLDTQHIDLIITDYRMPMMTGTDLLLKVKQRHPEVPAIMLSGQADLVGVTAAINAGVLNQYVSKPWDAAQLALAIKTTLQEQDPSCDRRTGMGTGRELNRRLAMLPEHDEEGRLWLLVIVDVVDMAGYNDKHGKASGNRLIQHASAALQKGTRQKWYRSGDKFMTLMAYSFQGHSFIDQINKQLKQFCSAYPQDVAMHSYIAEAHFWPAWDECHFSNVKVKAYPLEQSLCWLLQEGNCEIAQEYRELGLLIQDLDSGHVEAFFQPQLTLETKEVHHCEALARRKLPDNSYQSPADFLHLISKYDLDDLLLLAMIEQAAAMLIRIGRAGQLCISINVNAKQLISGLVYELLEKIDSSENISISDIEIEVVEGDQIFDYQRALLQFQKLHALGVTIAMDDFGTGYSGFESLCELPFDVVKIDGRFVRTFGQSLSDEVILSSMINSAKSLNMEVVAEWVENQPQADYLKHLGCTRIQGHFVNRPLPQDEFLHFFNIALQEQIYD